MDIFERISQHRAEEEKLQWTGTFRDYVEIVRNNPRVARTAHARVYDMIAWHGIREENGRKKVPCFSNKGSSDWTEPLRSWWRNIFIPLPEGWMCASASCCSMGPVSGGKSTIVTMLKRGLEQLLEDRRGGAVCDQRMSDA